MKKILICATVAATLFLSLVTEAFADPRQVGIEYKDVAPDAKITLSTHDPVIIVYPSRLVELRDLYIGGSAR